MKSLTMDDYRSAKRLGVKEYASYISQGRNGYLPFLDGVLKNIDIVSEVDLGIVEIPLEKVKGTYTYLRSISFARNFMPLMDEDTEFALKWQHVHDIQETEGLRDPFKVYEYLNWFYIIEGNKRVSVLKYMGIEGYPAEVSRLIPRYDETDKDIRIYYEFLDFYKQTGINEIWFSRDRGFTDFWELIKNYRPVSKLSEEKDRFRYFKNAVYHNFKKVFKELGGDNLPITTGDALLDFMKLNGVPNEYDDDLLRPQLKRFLTEVATHAQSDKILVQTAPVASSDTPSLFSFLTRSSREVLKVGFAFTGNVTTTSWSYAHEFGRKHIENVFGAQIHTLIREDLPENADAAKALQEMVDEGCKIIFATSPPLINASLKVAMDNPEVLFMNCSGWHSFKHVNTYFGRIHEARFLCGIIAGVMAKSNVLGYIAPYPVPDVMCGINAFTLGAHMIRPDIRVQVEWSFSWDKPRNSKEATQRLGQAGVDIISHHNTLANRQFSPEYGVYSIVWDEDESLYAPENYLAVPVWNWGVFYEKIVRSYLAGNLKPGGDEKGAHMRNYWWGMDSGLLDFFYSKALIPQETSKLVELIKNAIVSNSFNVFTGPVYDREGNLRVAEGETADHDQILSMDWFVDGVVGEIPVMSELLNLMELSIGKLGETGSPNPRTKDE